MAAVQTFSTLAFDGGPGGLLEVLVLKQIEAAYPGFLKATRMFAGTSAGSINALVLASVEDGATKLDALEDFWQNIGPTFSNTSLGFVGALFGVNALFNNKALIEHLSAPELLGGLKMSDLVKPACAAAFNVKAGHGFILSNLQEQFPGYGWPCVDVAVSSGASPMVMPAHLGYIDGGVFSNNPTRPTISALHDSIISAASTGAQLHPMIEAISESARSDEQGAFAMRVLSIAGGKSDINDDIGSESWGYGRWLLDPDSFMRIVGLMLSATTEVGDVIGAVSSNLNYFRLDPNFINKSFIPFIQADPKDLRATAASPVTTDLVYKAVHWMRTIDWIGGQPKEAIAPVVIAVAPSNTPSPATTIADLPHVVPSAVTPVGGSGSPMVPSDIILPILARPPAMPSLETPAALAGESAARAASVPRVARSTRKKG